MNSKESVAHGSHAWARAKSKGRHGIDLRLPQRSYSPEVTVRRQKFRWLDTFFPS
jgi:hypothetical protein